MKTTSYWKTGIDSALRRPCISSLNHVRQQTTAN